MITIAGDISEHAEGAYADERHQLDSSGFDPNLSYEYEPRDVTLQDIDALAASLLDRADELGLAAKATYLIQEAGQQDPGVVTPDDTVRHDYRLEMLDDGRMVFITRPDVHERPETVEITVEESDEPVYRIEDGKGKEIRDVEFDYEEMVDEAFYLNVQSQLEDVHQTLERLLSLLDQ